MTTATLLAGLSFGDEGKGTTVDHLVRTTGAKLVVRYNGGAQAAHNVVTSDGRHHTFAQLGSGTFAGARTYLSRFMLINPIYLVAEAKALADKGVSNPLDLVTLDPDALVTTPYHVAMNRLREMARSHRHGSCGMGIGETMEDSLLRTDVLRMGDVRDRACTKDKLADLRARKLLQLSSFVDDLPESEDVARELSILEDESLLSDLVERYAALVPRIRSLDLGQEDVIFEGAQGVLLDQDAGFHPHTTWTDTTFGNAYKLLEGFTGRIERLGIVRAYATRHGAGPFPTENRGLDRLSGHDHNRWGEWQGSFRSGAFDQVLLRYALDVLGGVDSIVMTNLDRLSLAGGDVPVAMAYENVSMKLTRTTTLEGQEALGTVLSTARPVYERIRVSTTREALDYAARVTLGVPLTLASFGATSDDKVRPSRRSRIELQAVANA